MAACSRGPADIEWRAPAMGTTYVVKAVAVPPSVTRESLQAETDAILRRIDSIFSTYRNDSEISRFNRGGSVDWQPASAELVTVVTAALELSRVTGGAFDVTAGPLVSLWGFGPEQGVGRIPDAKRLAAARRRLGYQKLQCGRQPYALRKQVGDIQVDLNALAAGYAADAVAAHFEQIGIRNYMVDMGGELRLRGHNTQGKAWSIAIELPLPEQYRTGRILELTDGAVSTSGTYRNFFEVDGKRFPHVLDARSGWPVQHDLASVTVLAPTAMRADAWATALLILGKEEGHALAEREGVAALFIAPGEKGFAEKVTTAFSAYPVH
jgi:thiamine biosynthesis lipoprotein